MILLSAFAMALFVLVLSLVVASTLHSASGLLVTPSIFGAVIESGSVRLRLNAARFYHCRALPFCRSLPGRFASLVTSACTSLGNSIDRALPDPEVLRAFPGRVASGIVRVLGTGPRLIEAFGERLGAWSYRMIDQGGAKRALASGVRAVRTGAALTLGSFASGLLRAASAVRPVEPVRESRPARFFPESFGERVLAPEPVPVPVTCNNSIAGVPSVASPELVSLYLNRGPAVGSRPWSTSRGIAGALNPAPMVSAFLRRLAEGKPGEDRTSLHSLADGVDTGNVDAMGALSVASYQIHGR